MRRPCGSWSKVSPCRHQPVAPTILPGRDAKLGTPRARRRQHPHRLSPMPGRRCSQKSIAAKAGLRSPSRQEAQGYHRVISFSYGGSRCCPGQAGFPAHPHMLRPACGFAPANKGHDTRAMQAYPATATSSTRSVTPNCPPTASVDCGDRNPDCRNSAPAGRPILQLPINGRPPPQIHWRPPQAQRQSLPVPQNFFPR
jgi:hypothetical protein